MNKSALLEKLSSLDFQLDDYIVVGGGALTILGLKETYDIDLVVSSELFRNLQEQGWESKIRPNGKPGLRCLDFEAYLDVNSENVEFSFEELLKDAFQVEGVNFINLKALVRLKTAYGRPKDFGDLELLRVASLP